MNVNRVKLNYLVNKVDKLNKSLKGKTFHETLDERLEWIDGMKFNCNCGDTLEVTPIYFEGVDDLNQKVMDYDPIFSEYIQDFYSTCHACCVQYAMPLMELILHDLDLENSDLRLNKHF